MPSSSQTNIQLSDRPGACSTTTLRQRVAIRQRSAGQPAAATSAPQRLTISATTFRTTSAKAVTPPTRAGVRPAGAPRRRARRP